MPIWMQFHLWYLHHEAKRKHRLTKNHGYHRLKESYYEQALWFTTSWVSLGAFSPLDLFSPLPHWELIVILSHRKWPYEMTLRWCQLLEIISDCNYMSLVTDTMTLAYIMLKLNQTLYIDIAIALFSQVSVQAPQSFTINKPVLLEINRHNSETLHLFSSKTQDLSLENSLIPAYTEDSPVPRLTDNGLNPDLGLEPRMCCSTPSGTSDFFWMADPLAVSHTTFQILGKVWTAVCDITGHSKERC